MSKSDELIVHLQKKWKTVLINEIDAWEIDNLDLHKQIKT